MAKLTHYLLEHVRERSEPIKQLEKYAEEHRIPIMDPVSIDFLMQLIRIKKPKWILEIGTAIGYSALRMSEAFPEAKITTIERDDHLYDLSLKHIKQLGKEEAIKVLHGDALNVLSDLASSKKKTLYDVVFIDAAKAQYQRFFELVKPILADNALVVSDNILFKGLVVNSNSESKRLNNLAGKIRHYNKWLTELEGFNTSIVPIGDGIAISVRI